MATAQMQPGQELTATIQLQPAGAEFDGMPSWSVSDEAVASVTPSEDGLSALIRSLAKGSVTVTVTGDGKHGDDVAEIVASGTIVVTAPDVQVVELTFGAPVAVPVDAPVEQPTV